MIQNIEISKLCPHPDNPRKELGDLTELADSIKANGIFQNLTVVPYLGEVTGEPIEGLYRVIIGHRRLAAAKLAGLTEVPCAISDMDYKKQISTMLLENMQRSDLTVYEQAQGFQMMLDLGESINDISQNTGFSETTVRRRIKLLELDKEKFRQSAERGGTLMDYAELDKIHDVKARNKVLEKIGTADFRYELQRAIYTEGREKNKALIIAELEKFATQIKSEKGFQWVRGYYPTADNKIEVIVPDDVDTVEYFFQVSNYNVTLYKKYDNENSMTNNQSSYDEKQKEQREKRAALDEMSKRIYQLRGNFVKEISNSFAKKNMNTIIEYFMRATLNDNYYYPDVEEFADFMNIKIDTNEETDEWNFDDIKDQVTAQPERYFLLTVYLTLDSERVNYYNWNNQYVNNETLNTVYDFLVKLGYEISEEESLLRNGTHKLFSSEDAE